MTLTEFLLARIAEDEEIARDATNDGHRWLVQEETIELWPDDLEPATGVMHFPRKAHAYHAATWNPERVLAECAAKRRIVASFNFSNIDLSAVDFWLEPDHADLVPPPGIEAEIVAAKCMAMPFSDHPDWREEWRA